MEELAVQQAKKDFIEDLNLDELEASEMFETVNDPDYEENFILR